MFSAAVGRKEAVAASSTTAIVAAYVLNPARGHSCPQQSALAGPGNVSLAARRLEPAAGRNVRAPPNAGLPSNSGSNPSTAIPHGKSNGRLVALVPVNKAAERMDSQRSEIPRDSQARRPKSIAARA